MSTTFSFRLSFLTLVMMAMWVPCVDAMGDDSSSEAARIDVFAHPDGKTYFALSLNPTVDVSRAEGCDVVVLFDTSSSQVGKFREDALAALDGLLAGLRPSDRVRLFAVDLNAIPMQAAFSAPGSPELAAAVERLKARVPLGATNMEAAMMAAATSFSGETKPRACVYIGDGMSAANILGTEKFAKLVSALVESRVAVSSFAVGPRLDEQLLGSLAGRTGGVMRSQSGMAVVEKDGKPAGVAAVSPDQVGKSLAEVATGVVFWPVAVELPQNRITEMLPKALPPLRADRDSVVIGTIEGNEPLSIKVRANTPAGLKEMAWTVAPGTSEKRNDFLAKIVGMGRFDEGMSLPLIDSGSLQQARSVSNIGAANLLELAREALDLGNVAGAEQLAAEALRRKPEDAQAKKLVAEIEQQKGGGPIEEEVSLEGKPLPDIDEGALARQFQLDRKIIAEQVTKDVQVSVNRGRKEASIAGEEVIQDLKLQLENVRRMSELSPEVKVRLIGQLQAALRSAQHAMRAADHRRQQEAATRAAAEEREMIVKDMARKQEKVNQLMRRFHSLMSEDGYRAENYQAASEEVAPQALEIAEAEGMKSSEAVLAQAITASRAMWYHQEAQRRRIQRQRALLASLNSVDMSSIPINDNEPILYPPPEIWNSMSERRIARYSAMDLAVRSEAELRISKALDEPTRMQFVDFTLGEVVEYLKQLHDIPISLKMKALEEFDIGSDLAITYTADGISLRAALTDMLSEHELSFITENEQLKITTVEDAGSHRVTRVYPVGDLVIPIRNMPTMGMGMGMMGGMGGMGGMMGGMGGMGGMMGGMGGMGGGMGMGGMGMGGMMNAPREFIPRQLFNALPQEVQDAMPRVPVPGGFQAFSVEDDLSLPAAASASASADAARDESIELKTDGSENPDVVWEEYFRAKEPSEAAVRSKVRVLMGQKKYADVISLIRAALRGGHAQPWMYEAMSLAMQIDGRDNEEIERAIMSAVDWATSPVDLMYVAAYLADIGLNERALQVFRQVSAALPDQPEPYVHGLRSAQKVDDLEGIQWATTGILGRAWSKEQADVWVTGMRVANATLEQLKEEGRVEEAEQYEKSLNAALIRDVVVRVSWTGNADIDLMVEEPSGTVCSARNPRTMAGGMMLGDNFAGDKGTAEKEFAEVYVCPKAFSGDYKLLIRRVWGEVTAGKVTVDVYFNWNTKAAMHMQKRIELADNGAEGTFALANGRRTELLTEQQVANAAAGQLEIRRQVLATQLAAAVDSRATESLADAREGSSGANASFPLARPRGVGYQPQITMLSEGLMMPSGVTGVISADRRYVRITVAPMFTGIPAVNTFNFVTGQSGTSQGGTGGQGFGGMSGGMGGMGGMGGGMGMM